MTLDLLIGSNEDLSSLVEAFGDRVFPVYTGPDEAGGFYAVLEPPISDSPNEPPEFHAQHMASAIEGLPPLLLATWNRCTSRIFDFGFESGTHPSSLSYDLSQDSLARISACGASCRITVYPVPVAPNP